MPKIYYTFITKTHRARRESGNNDNSGDRPPPQRRESVREWRLEVSLRYTNTKRTRICICICKCIFWSAFFDSSYKLSRTLVILEFLLLRRRCKCTRRSTFSVPLRSESVSFSVPNTSNIPWKIPVSKNPVESTHFRRASHRKKLLNF